MRGKAPCPQGQRREDAAEASGGRAGPRCRPEAIVRGVRQPQQDLFPHMGGSLYERSGTYQGGRSPSFLHGFPTQWLLLFLLTAIAAAVRCGTLSFQSLWLDEISTVAEAGRPWHELLVALVSPQQGYPLYILGMRLWVTLWGTGEAALRWPSALAGLASVPLLWLLGRRLYGWTAGLLAAALLALSPLAVWYSQEAKAYAFLMLLTTAGWLLLWEAVEEGSPRCWWAFAVVTALALFVHRLAILSTVGYLLYALYVARQGRFTGRHRRLLVALLLVVLLATLAGLWLAMDQTGGSRQFGSQRNWTSLTNTFSQFSLRISPRAPEPGQGPDRRAGLLAFALLGLAGVAQLILDVRAGGLRRRRAVFLASYVGAPLGAFFALYLVRPFYHERYLLSVLPGYLLLLAVGGVALYRGGVWLVRAGRGGWALLLGGIALAGVLVPLALSWHQLQEWTLDRRPSKEQFREATRYLQEHLHPGDLVIVHPGYIRQAVEHYQARFSRIPLELTSLRAPFTEDYGFREFEADMDEFTRGRRRAWLFLAPYHAPVWDPHNWVYEWYLLNPFLHCGEAHFNGIALYCVSFNEERRQGLPAPAVSLDASFGGALLLWGATLEPFQQPMQPGDPLPVTLYVRGLQPDLPDLETVLRLVGRGDHVWAETAGRPLGGGVPTPRWIPGDDFLDFYELLLPEDLPADRYTVQVAYRAFDDPGNGWLSLPDGSTWATVDVVDVAWPGGSP